MASYRLSRMAETDLLGIATYTLNTWGQDQTVIPRILHQRMLPERKSIDEDTPPDE
jgi:plasmid stabilization system protein ParE